MELSLPGHYCNKIVKAIAEFDMIKEGDNILVGLSGGKDSAFLLYALAILRQHFAVKFKLAALTIDPGFEGADYSSLNDYCRKLAVPFYIKKTAIADYIMDPEVDNPCARCAHFRKGAMVAFMKEKGYNKLAFGHHYNDAVDTFLLSIIYSGQFLALEPNRYLSSNNIHIIRPLIYLREKRIVTAIKLTGFQPIASLCPYSGQTVRNKIKVLTRDKQIFYNLARAMREDVKQELWPAELPREELTAKMEEFWTH